MCIISLIKELKRWKTKVWLARWISTRVFLSPRIFGGGHIALRTDQNLVTAWYNWPVKKFTVSFRCWTRITEAYCTVKQLWKPCRRILMPENTLDRPSRPKYDLLTDLMHQTNANFTRINCTHNRTTVRSTGISHLCAGTIHVTWMRHANTYMQTDSIAGRRRPSVMIPNGFSFLPFWWLIRRWGGQLCMQICVPFSGMLLTEMGTAILSVTGTKTRTIMGCLQYQPDQQPSSVHCSNSRQCWWAESQWIIETFATQQPSR